MRGELSRCAQGGEPWTTIVGMCADQAGCLELQRPGKYVILDINSDGQVGEQAAGLAQR